MWPGLSRSTQELSGQAACGCLSAQFLGKIRLALVPKRTAQPSFFVMITGGGHHDNVSPQRKGRNIWQKHIRPRCLYVWQMF